MGGGFWGRWGGGGVLGGVLGGGGGGWGGGGGGGVSGPERGSINVALLLEMEMEKRAPRMHVAWLVEMRWVRASFFCVCLCLLRILFVKRGGSLLGL